ncbi:MAG: hypothetical protein WCT19_02045 [Candidatus Paceibacterota bacterium]
MAKELISSDKQKEEEAKDGRAQFEAEKKVGQKTREADSFMAERLLLMSRLRSAGRGNDVVLSATKIESSSKNGENENAKKEPAISEQ